MDSTDKASKDDAQRAKALADRRRLLKASAAAPLIATLHPSNAFALSSAAACLHRPGVDNPDTAVEVKVKKFTKDSDLAKCKDLPEVLYRYDDRLYEESVLTAQETRAALRGLTAEADALVGIAASASEGINEIIAKVNTGDGTMARFLNDAAIYNALLEASQEFNAAAGDVSTVTDRMEDAANWATLGAFRLAENMEALKENWFFKGYYERRGYREKAPFEIREQALGETYEALEVRERELYEWEQRLERQAATLGVNADPTMPPPPIADAPTPETDGDTDEAP